MVIETVRGLRKHEKLALQTLCGMVYGNMLEVQGEMGVSYTSTRRSIKSLEDLGYVWMTHVGDRGPKSPQTYMTTPLGYLASVIYNDLWDNTEMHRLNTWVCPRFIQRYHCFQEQGNSSVVREVAEHVLESIKDAQVTRRDPYKVNMQRRNIDTVFITQYNRYHPDKFRQLLNVCKFDTELITAWRTWRLLEQMRRVMIRRETLQLPGTDKKDQVPDVLGGKYPGFTE